jgi:hypothetical protein
VVKLLSAQETYTIASDVPPLRTQWPHSQVDTISVICFTLLICKPRLVADLKSRASKQVSATKDRFSSAPSSSPGYNPPRPGGTPPAPPPPAPRGRTLPPSSPDQPEVASVSDDNGVASDERIDWASLTEEDKQIFFSWLDEFFSRYTGKPISSFAPKPPSLGPFAPPFRRPVASAPSSPTPPSLPRRGTGGSNPSSPTPNSPPPPMPPRRTSSQSIPAAPRMPPRRTTTSQSGEDSPASPTPNVSEPPAIRRNLPPPAPASGPVRGFLTPFD